MMQVLQFSASARHYGPSMDFLRRGLEMLGCEPLLQSRVYGACEVQV